MNTHPRESSGLPFPSLRFRGGWDGSSHLTWDSTILMDQDRIRVFMHVRAIYLRCYHHVCCKTVPFFLLLLISPLSSYPQLQLITIHRYRGRSCNTLGRLPLLGPCSRADRECWGRPAWRGVAWHVFLLFKNQHLYLAIALRTRRGPDALHTCDVPM